MDVPEVPPHRPDGTGTGRPPYRPEDHHGTDRPGIDRATLDWAGGTPTVVPDGDQDRTDRTLGPSAGAATADYAMAAWAAELVADQAADDRRRTQWLQRQAAEEGALRGVLQDLAERQRPVMAQLVNGRLHRGVLAAVGSDFVAVRVAGNGQGRDVLVRHAALFSVRTAPGEPATLGDRWLHHGSTLLEVLQSWRDDRATVTVFGSSARHTIRGELRAVGQDVLTLRLDVDGGLAYVALASADEISLDESG